MSSFGSPGLGPPGDPPTPPAVVPTTPPQPPQVDMMACDEMQSWLRRLQAEDRRIGRRNKYLAVAFSAGVLLLVVILWGIYRATIGAYAVLDEIRISHHPIEQGRLLISFRVLSPGKVHCRRVSGPIETDVIDYFHAPTDVQRPWSWVYRPGESIDVVLWYRRGLFRRALRTSFPTLKRADIVILMDTTGSMNPSIAALKEKCATFSEKLEKQALRHRFALIGFGDRHEGPWLDQYELTSDIRRFTASVADLRRFDGGDFPESALDALEAALELPLDGEAIRRFYLVTDADYHEPSGSGLTAEDLAERLRTERVSLRVFSKPEHRAKYATLLGDTGKFLEIENFGAVLTEGRLLED